MSDSLALPPGNYQIHTTENAPRAVQPGAHGMPLTLVEISTQSQQVGSINVAVLMRPSAISALLSWIVSREGAIREPGDNDCHITGGFGDCRYSPFRVNLANCEGEWSGPRIAVVGRSGIGSTHPSLTLNRVTFEHSAAPYRWSITNLVKSTDEGGNVVHFTGNIITGDGLGNHWAVNQDANQDANQVHLGSSASPPRKWAFIPIPI